PRRQPRQGVPHRDRPADLASGRGRLRLHLRAGRGHAQHGDLPRVLRHAAGLRGHPQPRRPGQVGTRLRAGDGPARRHAGRPGPRLRAHGGPPAPARGGCGPGAVMTVGGATTAVAGGRSGAPPSAAGRVSLRGLTKRFGGVTVVDGLDLEVEPGSFTTLLGPSGCGKTTVLRMVAGFVEPDAGSVLVGERDVTPLPPDKRGVGLVFQDYALFPHMTVRRNVEYGLRMRRLPRAERLAR